MKRMSTVVAGLCLSATANAMFDEMPAVTFRSGNDLYQMGKSANAINYVIGVLDGTPLVVGAFCVPEQATAGQLTDVVFRSLEQRPESRHKNAASLIRDAMREAFPCKR